MFDWINDLWGWVDAIFKAVKDYLVDLPLLIMKDFFDAFAGMIESIPVPDFVASVSIGGLLSGLPSGVLYFLDQSGLNEGMAILAGAFAFRMARKALTLFQW